MSLQGALLIFSLILSPLSVEMRLAPANREQCGRPAEQSQQPPKETSYDIEQGRDLNQYEKAVFHIGPYAFLAKVSSEEAEKGEALARQFVWEHWRAHKRGYLIITWHELDAASDTHYFIEPNEAGEWRVARKSVHFQMLPGCQPELRQREDATIVEYAGCGEASTTRAKQLESTPDFKSCKLIFKDKSGQQVGEL